MNGIVVWPYILEWSAAFWDKLCFGLRMGGCIGCGRGRCSGLNIHALVTVCPWGWTSACFGHGRSRDYMLLPGTHFVMVDRILSEMDGS